MSNKPVKESPIVPRRLDDDRRMTRAQHDALMNSESGGQSAMYRSASLTDTLGRDDEHAEGCLCDAPASGDEIVEDEHLPETGLVPGLDRSPPVRRRAKK